MENFFRYIRTASFLRPRQLLFFVVRRIVRPQVNKHLAAVEANPSRNFHLSPILEKSVPGIDDYQFTFINKSRQFDRKGIDWVSKDRSRLWRYNLHYFDYLLDADVSRETASQLVTDWIQNNPAGTETAWESYPVSLRIVNWIKKFSRPDFARHVQKAWLDNLYSQASWLDRNVEYHILANHFLKNGLALVFSGAYFEGPDAERWLEKGLKIIMTEVDEQLLADGGHYERSPMYHSIVVEDYLDALNLLRSNQELTSDSDLKKLESKVVAGLDYLNDICHPDGEIPLFNDAAMGIAQSPAALFEYGHNLIGYTPKPHGAGLVAAEKKETGYYVIRDGVDMMIIDCGAVGPDYQPGHAHCDTLSYELDLEGHRVIVDSGVYDYEDSPMRRYVRSTKAHNTVAVDHQEQSEVWGVFRVARRARPVKALIEQLGDSKIRFIGVHDGYQRLRGRVTHERTIEYEMLDGWHVCDRLQGTGKHLVESYIHIHPDLRAILHDHVVSIVDKNERRIAAFTINEMATISIEKSWYCPEFGLKLENDVIILSVNAQLPAEVNYSIKKV